MLARAKQCINWPNSESCNLRITSFQYCQVLPITLFISSQWASDEPSSRNRTVSQRLMRPTWSHSVGGFATIMRATGSAQPRFFSAGGAYRLIEAMSCQVRSLIQPATVVSKMSVLKNVVKVCLLSYTWRARRRTTMLLMSLPLMKVVRSHDSKRHKPPPFLLELRDRQPTKLKPHQIPCRVTTRTQ